MIRRHCFDDFIRHVYYDGFPIIDLNHHDTKSVFGFGRGANIFLTGKIVDIICLIRVL